MTDNTPPEALRLANVCSNLTRYSMDAHLIAAELRRQHTRIAELEAQIEALSGMQALSTAPAGWKLVPVEPTTDQEWAGKRAVLRGLTMAATRKIYKAMLAAAPLPPTSAEGLDHG